MGKMLTNNLGLKILSLFLAIVLWLAIITAEDPVITRDFSDIKITEINGDKLTEGGKAYSYTSDDTVSIRAEGRTSIVGRLTANDFEAVADLSKMSLTGAVVVDVSCPKYPSVEITPIGSSNVVTVTMEDLSEKSLSVRVVTEGKVADNKYIGTGTAVPNLVTVSGPASEVGKVKDAVAYVTANNTITSDINTTTSLVLLDSDGNEINSTTLKCSESDIRVQVPVYNTKTVPISFDVTGEVADGYQLVSAVYEPKEITLAGTADALSEIDELVMTNYDLTDQTEDVEISLPIASSLEEALPDGVVFVDSDQTLALVAKIEPIETRSFSIPLSNIQLDGSESEYKYELSIEDSNLKVLKIDARGLKSLISDTGITDFTASVDVADYEPGEYILPVTISGPEELEILGDYELTVTVSEE